MAKEVIVREKRQKNSLKDNLPYIVIGLVIFYIFTSASVTSQTAEVTKTVREPVLQAVTIEKPVKTVEYYQEKTPFTTEGCDNYPFKFETSPEDYRNMKGEMFANVETKENFLKCNFTVTNLEDQNGTFVFNSRGYLDIVQLIPAKASATFQWIHKIHEFGDNLCKIEASESGIPKIWHCLETKDTSYKIVERAREVTKLQNVTEYLETGQTRTVTKLVNETKYTYTNRLFGYNQFFYLGY